MSGVDRKEGTEKTRERDREAEDILEERQRDIQERCVDEVPNGQRRRGNQHQGTVPPEFAVVTFLDELDNGMRARLWWVETVVRGRVPPQVIILRCRGLLWNLSQGLCLQPNFVALGMSKVVMEEPAYIQVKS